MYIFVSSIGRSGTKYLSELFKNITVIPSFHYIEPICHGQIMKKKNNNKDIKIPEIEKKIKILKKYENIFESSHIFLRVYVDEVLKQLKHIYVIHLTRDPLEVGKSYNNRGSEPGNLKKLPWRLPVNLKYNRLHIKTKMTKYQKNLYDWIENEMRYQEYKLRFDKTFDLYFDDLNNIEKIENMLKYFNINYNKNKLSELHLLNLKKNENKKKTIIEEKNIIRAKEFIKILKNENINLSIFNTPYYQKYEFCKWMFE